MKVPTIKLNALVVRDGLNLSYDRGGGGPYVPAIFYVFFLLKISPLDQTLRPTCKFLILAIFYHAILF